jgi:cation/acetate symporter
MNYHASPIAIVVFCVFVGVVLGLSFYLGRKARSGAGFYAAHGTIPWFVNGIAFAGDYLSAASFLGICGMIAFYGYDGFLYSIGYLAGWVVALFVIAEPIKRLGKYTFADALDAKFHSRGIKLAAAISTLVVSIFYLIPQMVGAGALVKPLLGLPHYAGVLIVGAVVIVIVVTAGMVSTTWVQFIKGSLLLVFCLGLTIAILARGLKPAPAPAGEWVAVRPTEYLVEKDNGKKYVVLPDPAGSWLTPLIPLGTGSGEASLSPVGHVLSLPEKDSELRRLGPLRFLSVFSSATLETWGVSVSQKKTEKISAIHHWFASGSDLLLPGKNPTFKGVRSPRLFDKLDFISLMLALFCGTASLPHILIRYYTVKDAASARKSTVVGIASIGFFYILTLYIGLGAMVSGNLDPTDSNMAAPLLARSFGELPFAVISAIAFTTVLGTVSGLIMAASGAVAHDIMTNFMQMKLDDHQKVRAGKIVAVVVGAVAMGLGVAFKGMNVSFLVGWAFNVAASANLPALIMLLFWRGTTKQGITASITIGMLSSLAWILLSPQCFKDVYGIDPSKSIIPFSQPGLVTIPLGFVVLVAVSLATGGGQRARGFEVIGAKSE